MGAVEKPPATPDPEQSGLQVFLRVVGLLVVGPALLLYVISLIVS